MSSDKFPNVKLGASLGYFAATGGIQDQREVVLAAERLGYDSIWIGEPYGNDGPTILGWMAALTERIKLGSSILAIPGRTATMTAQTAATLDVLSGNRTLLGLGTSGPQVAEGWHGQSFAKQLTRTREYVEVVRMALRREVVSYDGETIKLPRPGGAGKPLKMLMHPPRADVPIYLAAMGPKNTALCGEIADGWLPLWFAPEHSADLRAPLLEGIERGGKAEEDVTIVPGVPAMVTDDVEAARDLVRPFLALYVGGMGSREQNFYKAMVSRYGYGDVAQQVQDLYLDGKKGEAARLLPDDLIDMLCLLGPVEAIADRMQAWAVAGVETLMVIPMAFAAGVPNQLESLMEAGERSGVLTGASDGDTVTP